MMRIPFGECNKIAYVEGENATPLGSRAQELLLVQGVTCNPLIGCSGYIMTAVYKRLLQCFYGRVSIEVEARFRHG